MSNEYKVAADVAKAEFEKWGEAMGLDFDVSGLDDEDKKSFVSAERLLVKAIQDGALVVNDKGEFVVTPTASDDKSQITFHEPSGASLLATDGKKKGHDVAKMFAFLADITGQPQVRFSKMKGRDNKICGQIAALFLA